MIARTCLALFAVLGTAWLVLSLRNDLAAKNGLYAVIINTDKPLSGAAAQRSRARGFEQLHEAQLLNPDKTPVIYEALARSLIQHRPDGLRRLMALSRSYPQDPAVWLSIGRVTRPSEPLNVLARKRLQALKPLR